VCRCFSAQYSCSADIPGEKLKLQQHILLFKDHLDLFPVLAAYAFEPPIFAVSCAAAAGDNDVCHAGMLAVGYMRYLLDTISKRELLTWLQLVPQRWWSVLHYADDFNYGGVEAAVSPTLWEAGGVPARAGPQDDLTSDADDAGVDDAEIGTPGGPRLRCCCPAGSGAGAGAGQSDVCSRHVELNQPSA
jgi:hypothetical protein